MAHCCFGPKVIAGHGGSAWQGKTTRGREAGERLQWACSPIVPQAPPQQPDLPTDAPLNGSSTSQQCHTGDQALDAWASRGHSRPNPWHIVSSPALVQKARPHLPALAGAWDSGSAGLAASLQAEPVERQDRTQRAAGPGGQRGRLQCADHTEAPPSILGVWSTLLKKAPLVLQQ